MFRIFVFGGPNNLPEENEVDGIIFNLIFAQTARTEAEAVVLVDQGLKEPGLGQRCDGPDKRYIGNHTHTIEGRNKNKIKYFAFSKTPRMPLQTLQSLKILQEMYRMSSQFVQAFALTPRDPFGVVLV